MKFNKAQLFLISVTAITFFLWLLSKPTLKDLTGDPGRSISQIFGLVGILYLMISFIFATRSRYIEERMGGLDKVYDLHRVIGSVAFILLMNHALFLAVGVLPNFSLVSMYVLPGSILAYNLGIFSLYTMIFAFVFMAFIKLPYHIWKRTHQILGLTGILGGFHALIITSDISAYFPLRYWMALWIVLGIASFIYIFVYYNWLGEVFVYEVSRIERLDDVINIYSRPMRRKIGFQPGQFGYITFANPRLGPESHPFSFSSAPDEEELRISAKILGDYTARLPFLQAGDKMYIKGPYGRLGDVYIEGKRPLVWVVGGIGVTPFLSMLRNEARMLAERKILLFYCFSTKNEGVFSDEIARLAKENSSLEVYEWCSADKGRFSVRAVADILKRFSHYEIQICGPGPMMESLRRQFNLIGIDDSRVHYESFQMI